MAEITLIIGNQRYSSWSLRGWLAAKHSGLLMSVVKIALFEDEEMARLKALSPSGLVPTLQDHRGKEIVTVWDSLAIIDYLNDTTDAQFWPKNLQELALARSLAAEMHDGYKRIRTACPMNLGLYATGLHLSKPLLDEIDRLCKQLELALKRYRDGPYLLGEWGAADMIYAPVATRIRSYGLKVTPLVDMWVNAVLAHDDMLQWAAEARGEGLEIEKYDNPIAENRLIYDVD